MEDENPGEVYIVAEDSAQFDPEDDINVVNLRDLHRNIKNPAAVYNTLIVRILQP